MDNYNDVVAIGGGSMAWAGLVKQNLSDETNPHNRERMWNACRYVVASIQLFYYSVNAASGGGAAVDDFEWDALIERGLLGAEEALIVMHYNGFSPFLLLSWALTEVAGQVDDTDVAPTSVLGRMSDRRKENILNEFRTIALTIRGKMGGINGAIKMDVPFPYFHLVNIILMAHLLLVAYAPHSPSRHTLAHTYTWRSRRHTCRHVA